MSLRKFLGPAVRNACLIHNRGLPASVISARRMASSYDSDLKLTTMDDLPVPNGSWETQYNANQTKYNMQLAAGAGFFIFTLIVAKTSGLIYFNWSPPPYPYDKE